MAAVVCVHRVEAGDGRRVAEESREEVCKGLQGDTQVALAYWNPLHGWLCLRGLLQAQVFESRARAC